MNYQIKLRKILERGLSDNDKRQLLYKRLFAEDLPTEETKIDIAGFIAWGIIFMLLIVFGYILF